MKIAVVGISKAGYVEKIISESENCQIEISCYLDWQMNRSDSKIYGKPVVSLEELKKRYTKNVDGIFIAEPSNHKSSLCVEKLFDEGIREIYILYFYLIQHNLNFLNSNGLFNEKYVYHPNWKKPFLMHLETHIVDSCNLNCKACNNFSPFYDETAKASFKQYQSDLKRLSEMFDNILRLYLLGGEPFLEPELLADFVRESRQYFPKAEIRIITNGLLLPQISDDVYQCIRENHALIWISDYVPTEKIKPQIIDCLNQHQVSYMIGSLCKAFGKRWTLYPFEDAEKSNLTCGSAGCHYLRNGLISKCPDALLIEGFDKKFHTNLKTKDAINIYKENNPWKIVRRLNHSIDLCRYCAPHRTIYTPWETVKEKPQVEDWMIANRYEYDADQIMKRLLKAEKEKEDMHQNHIVQQNTMMQELKRSEELMKEQQNKQEEEYAALMSRFKKEEMQKNALQEEIRLLQKKLSDIRMDLASVQHDYEEISNAVFWRISAPFRKIVDFIKFSK